MESEADKVEVTHAAVIHHDEEEAAVSMEKSYSSMDISISPCKVEEEDGEEEERGNQDGQKREKGGDNVEGSSNLSKGSADSTNPNSSLLSTTKTSSAASSHHSGTNASSQVSATSSHLSSQTDASIKFSEGGGGGVPKVCSETGSTTLTSSHLTISSHVTDRTASSKISTSFASSGQIAKAVSEIPSLTSSLLYNKSSGGESHGKTTSILLYKGGSEVSTTQADSAYSSLGPISNTAASCTGDSYQSNSRSFQSNSRSCQSNSRSGSSAHSGPPLKQDNDILKNLVTEKKISPERPLRKPKKKPRVHLSLNDESSIETAKSVQASLKNTWQESKAAKVATLSQALGFVDEFRKIQASKHDKPRRGPDESELNDLATNLLEASQGCGLSPLGKGSQPVSENRDQLPEETIVEHEKNSGHGFCVAVSLQDGMVMQTTPSLTHILGYPKDMWVGRSFIDFVHPLDRETFIKQVTESIGKILRESHVTLKGKSKKETYTKSESFFCRIRIYNGLKSGFSVKERKTRYSPFKLSVCFTELGSKGSTKTPESGADLGTGSSFLFITAIPLVSAYCESLEDMLSRPGSHSFITKHNSACIFSFIDDSAIPYIGFLPQEIFGEDIFDFIHYMDLQLLRNMFEVAMLEQGKPCRTKGIRFKVRNGGYIEVNSWWSCFINPWSRQLEFVHGKHSVIKGPLHPDVFADLPKETFVHYDIADKCIKQKMANQDDIKNILKKTVQKNNFVDVQATSSSKTKKELSNFMGSLLEEVARSETIKLGRTNKKVGDIVIGNISPHQSDSSETPPSYNQLTYNENLTRFFNSQPKTLSEPEGDNKSREKGSAHTSKTSEDTTPPDSQDSQAGAAKKGSGGSGEKARRHRNSNIEDGGSGLGSGGSGEQAQTVSGSGNGNSYTLQTGLSAGQVQSGQDECMMSMDGSGSGLGSGSRGTSTDAYNPPVLTIELLAVHNKDMERKMLSSYKQAKRSGDTRFFKENQRNNLAADKPGLNRLSIQKMKNKERTSASTPAKTNQPSAIAFDQEAQAASPMWRTYMENEARINNTTRPKHGHEGYMGFNQANMMQRGTPTSFAGFSNIVGVSNMYDYAPFRPDYGKTILYDQDQLVERSAGNRYPGSSSSLIARGMMSSGLACSSKAVVTNPSMSPTPASVPRGIICLPSQAGSESRKQFKYSRRGSRDTSVKGEPGSSALESNATASVKGKNVRSPGEVGPQPNKTNKTPPGTGAANCQSTSSSSLYSFLMTSEDYSLTNSSGGEGSKAVKHVAKPVLAEPFWNERVLMTPDLLFNYQLEVRDPKAVLKADLDLLATMNQHQNVEEQIMELLDENDEDESMDVKKLLTETDQWLLETESLSSFDGTSADEEENEQEFIAADRRKNLKKRSYLENLNIFMEAEAPFPTPDTLKLSNKMALKTFNFSDYSSSSDEGQTDGK